MNIYKDLFKVILTDNKGKSYQGSYDWNISLPTKFDIVIGFDQSNTWTGMAVKRVTGEFVCLIDIINAGLPTDYVYKDLMKRFLENISVNSKIKLMIIEKPWGGKKYSFGKLNELKGFMRSLPTLISHWNGIQVKDIYPQEWRSSFLISQNYKGRFKSDKIKDAVREEACIRYPALTKYAFKNKKVPDSLEALGIIDGYIARNYTKDGERIVNRTIDPKNYKIISQIFKTNVMELKEAHPNEDMYDLVLSKSRDGLYGVSKHRGYVKMKYNEKLTEKLNIDIACNETDKVVIIPIPFSNLYSSYIWNDGEIFRKGEYYFLAGYRANR